MMTFIPMDLFLCATLCALLAAASPAPESARVAVPLPVDAAGPDPLDAG